MLGVACGVTGTRNWILGMSEKGSWKKSRRDKDFRLTDGDKKDRKSRKTIDEEATMETFRGKSD